MGAIIEKHRNELSNIEEPLTIKLNIISDKKKEFDELNDKLVELQDVNEMNIELAKRYSEIKKKYAELKQQYRAEFNQKIEYYNKLRKLEFNLYCPMLDREISILNCNESCLNKYCKQGYKCKERNEQLIKHLNIYISRAF
jgi:uncharacterized protein YeaO (DUF488 family)